MIALATYYTSITKHVVELWTFIKIHIYVSLVYSLITSSHVEILIYYC